MSQVTEDKVVEAAEELGIEPSSEIIGRTPWQIFWTRFRRDRVALVALGFLVVLALAAAFAPLVAKLVGLNWKKIDAIMDLLKERGKRSELIRLLKRNQRKEADALLNQELSLASNPDLLVLAAA